MNNPVITPITGRIYEYVGVPNDVADAFNAADSKGKAFGALIRGKYPTTKQPAPEAADTET